jgi:hypothetical protein
LLLHLIQKKVYFLATSLLFKWFDIGPLHICGSTVSFRLESKRKYLFLLLFSSKQWVKYSTKWIKILSHFLCFILHKKPICHVHEVQNHFLTAALIKKSQAYYKIKRRNNFSESVHKKTKKSIYTYLIGNLRGVCEEKSLQVLVGPISVLDDCLCNCLHVSLLFILSIFIHSCIKSP